MKRLLAIILAMILTVTMLASCSKVVNNEDGSDVDGESESYGGSDAFTDSSNESNMNNENIEDNTSTGESDVPVQGAPTFNVKESTPGLKFALNEDKLSYTLVGRGDAASKDIVIDGHRGLPVTKIGYSAFGDDETITSVKLGDYVEIIDDQAFSMCSALASVTFGNGVKFLGDYAFRYCYALKSIELGKNLEVIKYGAFYECKNLVNIKAYGKIRIIEDDAFKRTGYSAVGSNWKNKVLYIGTNLIQAQGTISGTYEIEPDTTCIGGLAFYGCASLSGVVIPDSVHSIGLKAFANTTALNNITIGNGVTYIGESAFINAGYYKNTSNWSGNTLYIGNYLVEAKIALSGAYSVVSGTKAIADMAFVNCVNVTSVAIPDSVVCIGQYAFLDCTKLANVSIGSGVKEIGSYAFKDCSALKGITVKKTDGWRAGNIQISADKFLTKEDAAINIGIVYADKVLTRS